MPWDLNLFQYYMTFTVKSLLRTCNPSLKSLPLWTATWSRTSGLWILSWNCLSAGSPDRTKFGYNKINLGVSGIYLHKLSRLLDKQTVKIICIQIWQFNYYNNKMVGFVDSLKSNKQPDVNSTKYETQLACSNKRMLITTS